MSDRYTGSIGTASRVTPPDSPAGAVILGMYLLEITAREAPVFFRFHAVGVLSLAEIAGVPPAQKSYPDAAYQLVAFTLDADRITPTPDNMRIWQRVAPSDVDLHFHGLDDEQAAAMAEAIAHLCADGDVPVEPGRVANADLLWRTAAKQAIEHLIHNGTTVPFMRVM